MSTLQIIWFLLIGILLTGYAILDGFDLGVGIWYLFAKKDVERRLLLNAIGPVWDANEVWLLTGGGALFAAFPDVYATVFSGLYLALMLLLFALIFRAVATKFRAESDSPAWRRAWDAAFALGSIVPALLLGVALGNMLRGLPIDESKNYAGTFFGLLNPYALLIGVVGFAMLATHGALYIVLKSEDELKERAARWAGRAGIVFLALFVVAGVATVATQPRLLANYKSAPVLWLVPVLTLAAIVATGVINRTGRAGAAFVASSISIAGAMAMAGASLYPNLVPALNDAERSLTIFNASSSLLTLKTMLIVTVIGMPIVLAYTIWLYSVFRGKAVGQEKGY